MIGENLQLVTNEPVDTKATPKFQQRSQPKTPALRILREYMAGISVGWSSGFALLPTTPAAPAN